MNKESLLPLNCNCWELSEGELWFIYYSTQCCTSLLFRGADVSLKENRCCKLCLLTVQEIGRIKGLQD